MTATLVGAGAARPGYSAGRGAGAASGVVMVSVVLVFVTSLTVVLALVAMIPVITAAAVAVALSLAAVSTHPGLERNNLVSSGRLVEGSRITRVKTAPQRRGRSLGASLDKEWAGRHVEGRGPGDVPVARRPTDNQKTRENEA